LGSFFTRRAGLANPARRANKGLAPTWGKAENARSDGLAASKKKSGATFTVFTKARDGVALAFKEWKNIRERR